MSRRNKLHATRLLFKQRPDQTIPGSSILIKTTINTTLMNRSSIKHHEKSLNFDPTTPRNQLHKITRSTNPEKKKRRIRKRRNGQDCVHETQTRSEGKKNWDKTRKSRNSTSNSGYHRIIDPSIESGRGMKRLSTRFSIIERQEDAAIHTPFSHWRERNAPTLSLSDSLL